MDMLNMIGLVLVFVVGIIGICVARVVGYARCKGWKANCCIEDIVDGSDGEGKRRGDA